MIFDFEKAVAVWSSFGWAGHLTVFALFVFAAIAPKPRGASKGAKSA
jgi:hypothetical protein